jgi:hypothetical protein
VDPRDPRAYALAFERMLERQRDEQDDDEEKNTLSYSRLD